MTKKPVLSRWAAKTSGYQKLLISLTFAILTYIPLYLLHVNKTTSIIFCWDAFAFAMIAMMWLLFFTTSADEQQQIVKDQDDAITVIFSVILFSVCVSFSGAVLLIFNNNETVLDKELRTAATLVAITLSWVLLHTIFTIRYAHLYHDETIIKPNKGSCGIDFPDPEAPDYIDFAYFSFVIGMTFQVSDVTISSKTVRRYVLFHSLISFVFNTIIVALTVNISAGIIK